MTNRQLPEIALGIKIENFQDKRSKKKTEHEEVLWKTLQKSV